MKVICINGFNGKFSKDGVIEGKEYEGTFGPIQEGRLGVWTIEGIRGTVFPEYMFGDADRVATFEKVMDGNVYLNVKTNRKIKYYNGSIWTMGTALKLTVKCKRDHTGFFRYADNGSITVLTHTYCGSVTRSYISSANFFAVQRKNATRSKNLTCAYNTRTIM